MVYMGVRACLKRHTKGTLRRMGRKLKNILTCLYCNKDNEINVCHSDIHKHVSYKKWYKSYKYLVYRLTQKISDPMGENI